MTKSKKICTALAVSSGLGVVYYLKKKKQKKEKDELYSLSRDLLTTIYGSKIVDKLDKDSALSMTLIIAKDLVADSYGVMDGIDTLSDKALLELAMQIVLEYAFDDDVSDSPFSQCGFEPFDTMEVVD